MADQLQDFVQHMLDAGAPQETIDEGIKLFQSQHPQEPMVRSRTGQMYHPPTESISKDVVDGALGAVNPMNYADLAKTALTQNPLRTARDTAVGLAKMPFRIAGGLVTEPAKTLGALTAGEAVGAVAPLTLKPGLRTLGKGLETAGTKAEWPMQVAASHQILSGNPGGLAVMAVPPVLRWTGRGLQKLGGADLETTLPSGARNVDVKGTLRSFAPPPVDAAAAVDDAAPMSAHIPYSAQDPAPYRSAAKAADTAEKNAERLKAIDDAKEGLTASDPVIRESASATRGDGGRASMSTTFKKATDDMPTGGDPNPMIGGRRLNDYPPEVQAKYRQAMATMDTPVNAGPPRPSIRIMGKAATDLADGTVPVASKAPMPSDVRMDEMAAKFAEGPKPARVSPQDSIPASKSKGAMSATPGLTRADVESIGLNPDMPIKGLTPEAVAQIKTNRASRHQTNYANAVSDKGVRAAKSDMTSILEQSLLARKYGLDQ